MIGKLGQLGKYLDDKKNIDVIETNLIIDKINDLIDLINSLEKRVGEIEKWHSDWKIGIEAIKIINS